MPYIGLSLPLPLPGILTFFFFCASLTVNLMLQSLFLLLSIVFWLLAGGVANPHAHKASAAAAACGCYKAAPGQNVAAGSHGSLWSAVAAAPQAAGWIGLVVSGIAFYGAAAEMLNEMYQRTVLPLGVCNPGAAVLPWFQAAVGAVPLLGPVYLRCARWGGHWALAVSQGR